MLGRLDVRILLRLLLMGFVNLDAKIMVRVLFAYYKAKYGSKFTPAGISTKIQRWARNNPKVAIEYKSKTFAEHCRGPAPKAEQIAAYVQCIGGARNARMACKRPSLRSVPPHCTLRIAPNPNYPPTLGNLKAIVLNGYFAEKLNGKLHLRFDDTIDNGGPMCMRAKQAYRQACKNFYKGEITEYSASNRNFIYQVGCINLLLDNRAFICRCTSEQFKHHKQKFENCQCYYAPTTAGMIAEFYNDCKSGAAVIRYRCVHPPDAFNWALVRILNNGRRSPLLTFQSAIDDRIERVTLILRGKDLQSTARVQEQFYRQMGWVYPVCHYWGRNKLKNTVMSSSRFAKAGLNPQSPIAPTYACLMNLGFSNSAIRRYFLQDVGLTLNDTHLNVAQLIAKNAHVIKFISSSVSDQKHLQNITFVTFLTGVRVNHKLTPKQVALLIQNKGQWMRHRKHILTCAKTGEFVAIN